MLVARNVVVAVVAVAAWLLVFACSRDRERDVPSATSLSVLEAVARRAAPLAWAATPRAGAFEREADEERIVNEGWRATKQKRFDTLGARMPDVASGVMELGVSRFTETHLRVSLVGAREDSHAHVLEGRVVYERAFESTDRIVVSSATRLEELLVLRDARAPRVFAWHIEVPPGIARVESREGGFAFADAHGRPVVSLHALRAFDATGAPVALEVTWTDETHRLAVALARDAEPTFPVVIDPDYETSAWVDVKSRFPKGRYATAMAYDSARDELVVFGGVAGTDVDLNDTWTYGGNPRTWTRRAPPVSPSTRFDHGLVYDSVRNETVLFGGVSATRLNETWVWNGAQSTWTRRTPATSPPGRSKHGMAFDRVRQEVVVFGGNANVSTVLQDTWVWNGTTWTERTSASKPAARAGHAMAFDAARREVVLFGGLGAGYLGDTWVWNGSSWTERTVTPSPPGREASAVAFDETRSEAVLFGGYSLGGFVADTWTWNGVSWIERNTTASPSTRAGHTMAFDGTRGELVVFGGEVEADRSRVSDLWKWNGAASTWSPVASLTAVPERKVHAVAFDAVRGEIVLFGGETETGEALGDTWTWNGAASLWTLRSPARSPPGRSAHKMAFDSARGEVILFGGFDDTPFNDTWAWNGTTWAERPSSTKPPARRFHAMDFDGASGELVVFGGFGAASFLSDTWTWNGTTSAWTARTPLASPSARVGSAMAFDGTRSELVLFGGVESSGTYMNDTWTWRSATSTWTPQIAMSLPTGRHSHALASGGGRGEVLLFGGLAGPGASLGDTWIWDGAARSWTQRFPVPSPAPRAGHAVAFDTARGECVLFGGFSAVSLGDTWIHRTLGGTCRATADCLDGSTCVDGVCCSSVSCGSCRTCAGTSPGRCTPVLNEEDPDTCALGEGKSCSRLGDCKVALGGAVTDVGQCASGHLSDGVCCDTACNDLCSSCTASKKQSGERDGVCGATKLGTCACSANGDCPSLQRCDRGVCVAERGAACDGDHTVSSPEGTSVDCSPYRCEGATCRASCTRKTDCVDNADCAFDGKCVPFASQTPSAEGGCHTSGSSSAPGRLAWATLLFVSRARQRRRLRAGMGALIVARRGNEVANRCVYARGAELGLGVGACRCTPALRGTHKIFDCAPIACDTASRKPSILVFRENDAMKRNFMLGAAILSFFAAATFAKRAAACPMTHIARTQGFRAALVKTIEDKKFPAAEDAYSKLVEMPEACKRASDHTLGAKAARGRGDIHNAYLRYNLAGDTGGKADLDARYRHVRITADGTPPFNRVITWAGVQSFDAEERLVIDLARNEFGGNDGQLRGYLPALKDEKPWLIQWRTAGHLHTKEVVTKKGETVFMSYP